MRRLTVAALALCALVSVGAVTLEADPPEDSVAPLRGRRLHVDPASPAARQADAWRRSRPQDAARMRHIADQPIALWLGNWTADIRREVDRAVSAITGAGELPVFVAYNIPKRDCGQHSAGGAGGADAYRRWIRDFARGIRARDAVVILEPDALPQLTCLPAPDQAERLALLRDAVDVLRGEGAVVYIDAGHGRWVPAPEMAVRLSQAGVAGARGFSLNISNFQGTAVNLRYGEQLSRLTGGKHFIIDTSRNGRGGAEGSQWCNPRGQALGVEPTTQTGHPLADAFLWVKRPGESDGTCGGGPRAGEWWPEYALELSAAAETIGRVALND